MTVPGGRGGSGWAAMLSAKAATAPNCCGFTILTASPAPSVKNVCTEEPLYRAAICCGSLTPGPVNSAIVLVDGTSRPASFDSVSVNQTLPAESVSMPSGICENNASGGFGQTAAGQKLVAP